MILKKKNCVSNKIQYVVRIKNHSHESWPKKKKLQNMFWKRHVAMHKTGMSFVVIKRYRELLQLMWLRT